MFVDEKDYVDERENPQFILNLSEEGLFGRLGLAAFEIENYGYFDPNLILKVDFEEKERSLSKILKACQS